MTAPLIMSIEPAVPDQVAVPLLFSVRTESTTFKNPEKLIPAFALVVPLAPVTQVMPLRDEHIVPPVQFNGVEKFRTPGAGPARVPALKFTLVVEIVSALVTELVATPVNDQALMP